MEKQALLHYVAPCSLMCYTCPGLKDGAISECAMKLCNYFAGYYDFNVANFSKQNSAWLVDFTGFYNKLDSYSRSECLGCRSNPKPGAGCIPGCIVPACVKEHGVEFCADCAEFPCQRARDFFDTVNEVIGKDWEQGSDQIRKKGIENYFESKKDSSHYISYKK